MGVGPAEITSLAAQLEAAVKKAEDVVSSVKFADKSRLQVYTIAYACACVEHSHALLLLIRGKAWISTWPVLRAVIEAMAYVDQLDADPKQTLLDLQYGSLESRNSWTEAAKQADYGPAYASALPETNLKSEMTTLKNGGAKTDQMYERIKAVDVRIAKDFVVTNEEHTGRFIGMWKACSQSAHMGGDKILKLMCINNASEGVDVVPGRDPDIQILKEQVSACIAALGLVSIRVDSLISS